MSSSKANPSKGQRAKPRHTRLTSLTVRRYRGLDELRVPLARINLVTGRNGAGKTSLLEAAFLLVNFSNPESTTNAHVTRSGQMTASPETLQKAMWAPLFRQLDMAKPVEILGVHEKHGSLALKVSQAYPVTETRVAGATSSPGNEPPLPSLNLHFTCEKAKRVRVAHGSVRMDPDTRGIAINREGHVWLFPATMVTPNLRNPTEDAQRLAEMRQRKAGGNLVEALRIIEPRLRGVEDKALGDTPAIWADVDGIPELVPLAVLGDGMMQLARILLGIAYSRDGLVLIDELDSGLHHSLLPEVWTAIDQAARASNTQVLATTHSQECVEAAGNVLDLEDGVALHRLEADSEGTRHCVTYDPEALSSAILRNMETR